MLVGGVVGHPVEHDLDATGVAVLDQPVQFGQAAEDRVHIAEVGYVVAEVGHRRGVDRRKPDRLDAEFREVVEVRPHAAQVADAVTVAVREGSRVDLVDGAPLPPGGLGHRLRL